MGQVSAKMRKTTHGFAWYCPGCDNMHPLPDSWTFNDNIDAPTFSPSFKHSWKRFPSYTAAGIGVGESFTHVCHYIVTDGKVAYCGDSMHKLANQTIDMPDLPKAYRDNATEGSET